MTAGWCSTAEVIAHLGIDAKTLRRLMRETERAALDPCWENIGIGRRPFGTGSVLANAISSAGTMPVAAKRSSTRSRAARALSAKRSGRRSSGDCGNATKSAASPSDSRRAWL